MVRHVRPALVLLAAFSVLTGLIYPLALTGIAQIILPHQARGSVVVAQGRAVGSALIGQDFTQARYVHPRPSATAGAPYNAAASGGSNLGPTSKALRDAVAARVAALKADNPDAVREGLPIPADLVTASASGLDPDLSPQAALFQVPRVARARNLPEEQVRVLVNRMTAQPLLGWLGEPRVNVLELNLALDRLQQR